ncbi:TlpA family protein disulfide reductase [Flavobacterium sp. '19STA2R22 D10 B1']|uniref:TlpA family protein disulfide reductase n=1 Tax=Flavobacterium aerium TaxID=3037261 RepID=UPI00278BB745|nr:redoxin family protein [Flavobacterium sp. '19STA2R22 D10 B1']
MFSHFSKYLLFIPFLFHMSCNKNSKSITVKTSNIKNEIVLIFKENNALDTSSQFQSGIYFSENNNYLSNDLTINNTTKNDTIKLLSIKDKICLTHNFKGYTTYIYEFQKGDTVVFDYSKNIPYAEILNRKVFKYDLNFQVDFNANKPLEDFEFLAKFKRIRNSSEKQNYLNELKDYSIKTTRILDSLFYKKLICKSVLDLHKGRIKYYELNLNKNLFNINSIQPSDLNNDNLLYLKTYRYFLDNFAIRKYDIKKLNDYTYDYRELYDKIRSSLIFSQEIKEYLLFNSINKIAENNSNDDLNNYFLKFENDVHNDKIIEFIKNTYLLDYGNLKTITHDVIFINEKKQQFKINDILSKNKGKVIFIDFWASWCQPCLSAMPYSKKLHEEYKDQNVVFVYISIDNDYEKWRIASQKEGLWFDENNFLAINYPKALFYKELQLQTIPRYLIYNKNGELIHTNAPDPKSNTIRNELNKYLKM